jgi:phage tail sheath protein FI
MNTDFLHGVEVVEVSDGIRPIRTLKSSVIGLIGTAGAGLKNVATMVTSLRDAVTKFGEWDETDGFTIPGALWAIYQQFKATVVVVNVIDPATDTAAIATEAVTFSKASSIAKLAKRFVSALTPTTAVKVKLAFSSGPTGTIVLPAGVTSVASVKSADGVTTYTSGTHYSYSNGVITRIAASGSPADGATVEVNYVATLVAGTDYVVNSKEGSISRPLTGSKIAPGATITVGYSYVDPASAVAADIIGGVDETSGDYEGVWQFLASKTSLRLQPRILLAPGFTHQKTGNLRNGVVAQLDVIATRLGAIVLADAPNTTDEAAVAYRQDWGSARIYVLDPFVKFTGPVTGLPVSLPYSTVMAGVIAATDAEFGFWASPSNKLIKGIIGVDRPIEFALNDPNCRANYLNENEVTTIVYEEGYRTWGNRTTSDDPKFAFLNQRRAADIIQESILFAHLWAVDRNITKGYVESVVGGVNDYLRYLKSIGAVLGGNAWADPDINTPSVISQGQLFIDFDYTVPFVAERITFRAHLVNNYVTEIFD